MVKARPFFEARTAPLDSLGARGFRIVAWLLGGAFAATGLLFTALGAWPVLIFAGAEALLVLGLLALYRHGAARDAEWVTLEGGALTVRRRHGRRVESLQLDPFWARLSWEGSRLLIGQRGRAIEVGRFLGPEERAAFARELEAALYRYRHPVFDNPQLRG
ncbi:MAG: DUF2244 domain-containing protein [Rubritepida sp.]|jgi:uncharacterized membrane protein|nr:DUF2244 domain-containing protein [Rubritepida sp.]